MECGNNRFRKIGLWLIVTSAVFILAGCAESQSNRPDVDEETLMAVPAGASSAPRLAPSGGIVLSIENTPITPQEIIEPLKDKLDIIAKGKNYDQFRAHAKQMLVDVLMQKITDIKLYEKARKALPDNIDEGHINKIVEQQVQKFIANHGGNYARAEDTLKKNGMTWKEFRKNQKRAMLIQSFVSDQTKTDAPITYSMLLDYYNSAKDEYVVDATIKFRLIDIEMTRFNDANTTIEQANQKAADYAAEAMAKIDSGTDFAEVAKEYSHGYMASNGGLWKPVRPGSLAVPYNTIEKEVENLSPGQVAGPVTAGGHIFIIKLENKQVGTHIPFEQVQQEIQAKLMMKNHQKMVNEMIRKAVLDVDMTNAENFIEYCTQLAYRTAGR